MIDYIHTDKDFKDLIAIVSNKLKINPLLIEKDYWIMHILYSLQQQGIEFELKGGTSLSKGFGIINRFSEDIDIHIKTNFGLKIEGNADKLSVRNARKEFYDLLVSKLKVDGIISIQRDFAFDDLDKYRSGGIRLNYTGFSKQIEGVKEGILLEVGFDQVTPNISTNISSWVWKHLEKNNLTSNYIDNNAIGVLCYHPGYTFIEKLQTIVRKFRNRQIENESNAINFMRHYYDVYCLLQNESILKFIGSDDYQFHKSKRIKGIDAEIPLSEHPAFSLSDSKIRESFRKQYNSTSNLYYKGQPDFENVINLIDQNRKRF
jgi:hypothetical protein